MNIMSLLSSYMHIPKSITNFDDRENSITLTSLLNAL